MHLNETFLGNLQNMNTAVKADYSAKKPWKYSNKKKRESTFDKARAGNRLTNCVDAVQWGLRGLVPDKALSWYGGKGSIVWCSAGAETAARKVFEIHAIKNKTVNQLYKAGLLWPGDILTYMSTAHTNVYYGNGKSFDAGAREGASFKKWIKSLSHKTYKVGYILRIKDRAEWWVQAGAFQRMEVAQERAAYLDSKGYATIIRNDPDFIRIQCGAYSNKDNAQKRVDALKKIGVDAIIKEA